jgi:hypothetical protein
MNKPIILTATLLTAFLSPFTASAQTDAKYPASNFEPKVVFIDEALAKNSKSPAQDEPQKQAQKAEFDPQHPAAFFEPKVIFP